jgi:hypothetical protein
LLTGNVGFQSFFLQHVNSNIGQFINVERLIADAHFAETSTIQKSDDQQGQIVSIVEAIELVDKQIEATVEPSSLTVLQDQKISLASKL